MFLKPIDDNYTYENVQRFFEEDFDQLQRLSKSDSLVHTVNPSRPISIGNSKSDNDTLAIKHYSYRKLYSACVDAINKCSSNSQTIIEKRLLKGESAWSVAISLNISKSTYTRWYKKALIEFADKLYESTTQNRSDSPIDLRGYLEEDNDESK